MPKRKKVRKRGVHCSFSRWWHPLAAKVVKTVKYGRDPHSDDIFGRNSHCFWKSHVNSTKLPRQVEKGMPKRKKVRKQGVHVLIHRQWCSCMARVSHLENVVFNYLPHGGATCCKTMTNTPHFKTFLGFCIFIYLCEEFDEVRVTSHHTVQLLPHWPQKMSNNRTLDPSTLQCTVKKTKDVDLGFVACHLYWIMSKKVSAEFHVHHGSFKNDHSWYTRQRL